MIGEQPSEFSGKPRITMSRDMGHGGDITTLSIALTGEMMARLPADIYREAVRLLAAELAAHPALRAEVLGRLDPQRLAGAVVKTICKDFAEKLSEPIVAATGHALRSKQADIDLGTTRRA